MPSANLLPSALSTVSFYNQFSLWIWNLCMLVSYYSLKICAYWLVILGRWQLQLMSCSNCCRGARYIESLGRVWRNQG